ncbi:MAG: MBL fold metallo-hydrolase [Anaerolineae bacterium]
MPYPYQTVLPGLVVAQSPLPPGWNVDVAVTLVQGDRLAVVDTGVREFMPAAIEPALAALGRSLPDIGLIVNTHGHWDHVQGNAAVRDASSAPIWIHTDDAGLLESPPDRELKDGDTIDLGTWRFVVVHTPGHSAGMVCLYEPERALLIVSDAVQGYGLPGGGLPLYFHSGRQYRESLARLLALDMDTIVLGHAFIWSGEPRFAHQGAEARQYLKESLEASRKTEAALLEALKNNSVPSLEELGQVVGASLANDPLFQLKGGLGRLAYGSLRSELSDLGIVV